MFTYYGKDIQFSWKKFPSMNKQNWKICIFGVFFRFFFNFNCLYRLNIWRKELHFLPKTVYNIYLSFDTKKKLPHQKFTPGRRFLWSSLKFSRKPPKNEKSIVYPNIGLWHIKLKLVTSRLKKLSALKKIGRGSDLRCQKRPKKAKFGPFYYFPYIFIWGPPKPPSPPRHFIRQCFLASLTYWPSKIKCLPKKNRGLWILGAKKGQKRPNLALFLIFPIYLL